MSYKVGRSKPRAKVPVDDDEPVVGRRVVKSPTKKKKPNTEKKVEQNKAKETGRKRKAPEPEKALVIELEPDEEDIKPRHESPELREAIVAVVEAQLAEAHNKLTDFEDAAIDTLQRAMEDYVEVVFQIASENAQKMKRKSVTPEDIRTVAKELDMKRRTLSGGKKAESKVEEEEPKTKKRKTTPAKKPVKKTAKGKGKK